MDDVLIAGCTFQEQLQHLESVFQHLLGAGLKLCPAKCHLLQLEVKYLGLVISDKGVSTDPGKVEAVTHWSTPTGVTQLKRFFGLCSYYLKFHCWVCYHFRSTPYSPTGKPVLGVDSQRAVAPGADRSTGAVLSPT